MEIFVSAIKFYANEFFYSLMEMITPLIFYVPLTMAIATFLFAGCRLKGFSEYFKLFARPLLCGILQSLAVFWMYGLIIARALQGAGPLSVPVLVDELQCVLIIIFSFIFSRGKRSKFAWVWGILLFIFAWPMIGSAIHIISLYILFSPELGFYAGHISLKGSLIVYATIALLTIIQTLSMWNVSRNYFKNNWFIKSFIALFMANLGAGLIVKGLLLLFRLLFMREKRF